MEDLIKALQIFLKYQNLRWPTHCEHDELFIVGITKEEVSEEDLNKLETLGFEWIEENQLFSSFRFGSA